MASTAQIAPDMTEELSRVFALQRANQWNVKASTAEERKAKLAKLKDAVEAHADEIVAAVLEDTRKPEGEIRVTEVLNVLGNIQLNIDNLDEWMKPTEVTPSKNPNDKAMIVPEARGVCLILGPWNFPLGLTFGPLAAAVAAGNCCMVKLTDLCPATARVAGKIVREVFDESEVALFEGEVEVAQAMLELPFNHIFFTGSTRVGKIVMAAAAKHLATVTLELGGKSPVIVDEDADIDKVAADLAGAKQFNGGQACISPDYVFVREEQKDRLVEGFKTKVAENLYAEGKASREELLVAESASYHTEGTCTFYGTANSNQMMLELMGLQLPGSSFVNPNTTLRDVLTIEATRCALRLSTPAGGNACMADMVDERSLVNAIVGLLATGGSTNHTIHLVAMAHAAGIQINWDDFSELSAVVPQLTRIYPNGTADVNHFHAAGGMPFLTRELLSAGLLHEDITTVAGPGLAAYGLEPWLSDKGLAWREAPRQSGDRDVLRGVADPFSAEGGLRLLQGNLGRAVIKVSAVKPEHQFVEAPAHVFTSQQQAIDAFRSDRLCGDAVVVLREQGPRANGMPELHKLTPMLSVLQGRGHHVALVTDGRMSGASGTVPAAIHVSPESICGGPLARVRDGDVIRLDARAGTLEVRVDAATLASRPLAPREQHTDAGTGRELFAAFRAHPSDAEAGARSCNP